MAFTSGSVSKFSSTQIAAESVGSGDGVQTVFSHTLAEVPLNKNSVTLDYTIGTAGYQATDDGNGNISGTHITSGTVDYTTGAINITFSTAPDNGSAITCDYTAKGLLQAVLDFVTGDGATAGRDWTVLLSRNTRSKPTPAYTEPFGSDCKEIILSNTGLSGQESVIIGIREWKYPSGNAHGWDLNGYLDYQAPNDWNSNFGDHGRASYDTTWHHYKEHPLLPLINDTMYYWIYSNRQRIIVVVKVQSNYESCYLGFGRRFGNPSDYPYPLCVVGSHYGNNIYSSTANEHRFIAGPHYQYYTNWVVNPAGVYEYNLKTAFVPYHDFYAGYGVMDKTTSGKALMTPVYIVNLDSNDVYMDLDAVFYCVSLGIQSEDLLTFDSKSFRVFQNIHRNNYYDFMCVEEA